MVKYNNSYKLDIIFWKLLYYELYKGSFFVDPVWSEITWSYWNL